MEKVLVTGASGLLGSKIVQKAAARFDVYPTYATYPLFQKALKMNITDKHEVNRVLRKIRPDSIVHAAAETDVDKCESRKKYSSKINAEGTRIISEAANHIDANVFYVSTDYVFDGEKGLYTEEDDPHPINHYGFTKLLGEKYVSRLISECTILRPSVLYGYHPRNFNFATWVISHVKKNREITVVNDHYNSPTLADNLASVILEAVERKLIGIFHTAGSVRISRFEFAMKIAETFNYDKNLIKPIKMSELKQWKARRPKDSSLCVDKIRKEITTELLGVKQGLIRMDEGGLNSK